VFPFPLSYVPIIHPKPAVVKQKIAQNEKNFLCKVLNFGMTEF